MNLYLKRRWLNPNATIGELFIDGNVTRQCYTLELSKTAPKPCIPIGNYQIVLDYSNRFQRAMPHILNVPGYDGIRIHSGNTDADTEGCVLVGKSLVNADFIGDSRVAFHDLYDVLAQANNHGKISITISEEPYV